MCIVRRNGWESEPLNTYRRLLSEPLNTYRRCIKEIMSSFGFILFQKGSIVHIVH